MAGVSGQAKRGGWKLVWSAPRRVLQRFFGARNKNFRERRTTMRLTLALLFTTLCLGLGVREGWAQNPEGTIVGTVLDSSGARVAGAVITIERTESAFHRTATADGLGEFRAGLLPPGSYRVTARASGFADAVATVSVGVSSSPTVSLVLAPRTFTETVRIKAKDLSLSSRPLETTSSVEKNVIFAGDLETVPLSARSFANISYLAPMTAPVEPSDPTKARITAVSFAGSSGLNVDLSVDGGDNNDDWIGGFLQNYSPEAIQEFAVRTAQFDADTSRTNGGSVIISTRRGTDEWHGNASVFIRNHALNARNDLDNPAPEPKQPFSRYNGVATLGGPLVKDKLWFFSSFEYVNEDASIAYNANSLNEFDALAQLASSGAINSAEGLVAPGFAISPVNSIAVPSSVTVPFRDALFSTRVDWAQSARSRWFFRGSFDRNHADNALVQQATLPSTGATTVSNYYSILLNQQFDFSPSWLGSFTAQANSFHLTQSPNSSLGLALAFPFSTTFHTISGRETFGDSQFATPITAFPVERDQQKYQFRYDLHHAGGKHAPAFGVNFIHEPVLRGRLADRPELLVTLPQDPSFYANPANAGMFAADFQDPANQIIVPAGSDGRFSQSVRRLGFYAQDSWRIHPRVTFNYGLRYDTTFGLFQATGRDQSQNPAVIALAALNTPLPIPAGIPHDYRGAVAPRLGIAYAPGDSGKTVIRAGVGLYFNDLAQNGWANAFQAVNTPAGQPIPMLAAGQQGALIDPHYHSPYALQASFGVERALTSTWRVGVQYEHHQGVHQYRRYEYISGVTLPAAAPNVSVFRTDNRSRYDGVSFVVQHRFSSRFDLSAHYTLGKANTWGAVVGELFDYVNGVSDVRNPFGRGDYGPSGEDIRHRLVIVGRVELPWKFEASTLAQLESARPYTLSTSLDVNADGIASNDRAVVNGLQTSLDQFRGTPFMQVDLRISRAIKIGERVTVQPFAEFFNLFNRQNPGNNYVASVAALAVPQTPAQLANTTLLCVDPACTTTTPITNPNRLRKPAGALGDFFGLGTTVGIPFAAQFGIRLTF
jgi:hypothetical protein